jgi:hypothetical protein
MADKVEAETVVDALAGAILNGTGDVENAREIAARTGHPVLLDAFRKLGYSVTRIEDPQPTAAEAERQKRFQKAAIALANSPAGQHPERTTFADLKVRQVFDKGTGGDINAIREFADLVEGPAEWLIVKPGE